MHVYRHPSSLISIEEFTKNYLDPVLQKLSSENKICTLMGDFNINLLQTETRAGSSYFYNTMLSNVFAPYILQPTRPVSKSLIDNIFCDFFNFFYTNHPLQGFRSHCCVRGYSSLLVATAEAGATTRTWLQHTHTRTHNPQLNPLLPPNMT